VDSVKKTLQRLLDDCDGDLLEHIRNIVGSEIPIGVELDPHCHMTDKMLNNATAMVLYKTLRHTDIKQRAVELFNLIANTLVHRLKPQWSVNLLVMRLNHERL